MKQEKKTVSFRKIAHYYWLQIRKFPKSFFAAFFFYTISITLAYVVTPLYYKKIVDIITLWQGDRMALATQLFTIVAEIGGTVFLYQIFFRFGDIYAGYSQVRILEALSNYSFQDLIKHSYSFFSNHFVGGLVASSKRFENSFDAIHDALLGGFWITGVHLFGIVVSLFIVAPPLGIFFLIWALAYLIASIILAKKKVEYDMAEAGADSKVTAVLSDAIANILTVKTFAGGEREVEYYHKATAEQKSLRARAWNFMIFTFNIQSFFLLILEVVGIYISVSLWLSGAITAGTLVLANSYFADIFSNVWNIGRTTAKFMKSLSNAAEMVQIFETPPAIADAVLPEVSQISHGSIEFHNVGFSYGGNNSLLHDFSLQIQAGERVGIVGASGAGKSTLVKLLLRFFDVTAGSVTVDGQDIRNVTQDDLRRKIAYVPQDPLLFHRTLAENIAYGKKDVPLSVIEAVSKKAHAHEFISLLPKQYETLVGERGIKLSGGERQRVAIARAMLTDAPILVLDEATSSLDSTSELLIQDAFSELMKGKTTIVIAHRLSTIQKMDRIIVLDHGVIVEQGSHSELLDKKGAYFALWSHQTNGFLQDEDKEEKKEEGEAFEA